MMNFTPKPAPPAGKTETAVKDYSNWEQHNKSEYVVAANFPREFKKTFLENFDPRFSLILVATFLINFLIIAYLVMHPPPQMSSTDLERIQKQFARLVLDKAPPAPEIQFTDVTPLKDLPVEQSQVSRVEAQAGTATGRATGGTSGRVGSAVGENISASGLAAAIGRRTREQISYEVSRTGILGLLTSNSGMASGEAAAEVLDDTKAPMTNLDEALAGVTSINRGSTADAGGNSAESREVRGGRATSGSGIDALVQGLSESKTKRVQRSGDLVMSNEEPLIETEDGKVSGARNQDAVSAVIARHTSAIQYCYQRELKRNPNLKGKVVVRFTITPQGTVASATIVASTLNNPGVEQCVVERIKRWDDFGAIDPAKGNTTIRQVYTFGY
jgi:TonB family protein